MPSITSIVRRDKVCGRAPPAGAGWAGCALARAAVIAVRSSSGGW